MLTKKIIPWLLPIVLTASAGCNGADAGTPDGPRDTVADASPAPAFDFGKPLSREMVYARSMNLHSTMAMQSFDIDSRGDIYTIGTREPYVHIQKCPRGGTPGTPMSIAYAGHGTNMCIEQRGGDTYIWLQNFGNKRSNGQYFDEQIVSRVRFEPGRTLLPEECGEHFYIGPYAQVCPAVDTEHDLLCISCSDRSVPGCTCKIRIYSLSAALGLATTIVGLRTLSRGGEPDAPGDFETLTPTIEAHDLTRLKPLHEFCFDSEQLCNGTPMQGYCIYGERIYWYAGDGGRNDNGNTPPRASVSVIDFSGTARQTCIPIGIAQDLEALGNCDITDSGYFEAEGIKIREGKLYLGFATTAKKDSWQWRGHIFRLN